MGAATAQYSAPADQPAAGDDRPRLKAITSTEPVGATPETADHASVSTSEIAAPSWSQTFQRFQCISTELPRRFSVLRADQS